MLESVGQGAGVQGQEAVDPRPLLLSGLGEIPVTTWRRVRLARSAEAGRPDQRRHAGQPRTPLRRPRRGRRQGRRRIKYPPRRVAQVRKLRGIVELPSPAGDDWSTYTETHTYDAGAVKAKEAFVARGDREAAAGTVLDLGTNTGQYARLARTAAEHVVAVDISAGSIDALYRSAGADTHCRRWWRTSPSRRRRSAGGSSSASRCWIGCAATSASRWR